VPLSQTDLCDRTGGREGDSYIFSLVRNRRDLKDGTRVSGHTRPHIGTFLGARARHSGTFHLSFIVDDDASIVFEVDVSSFLSSPALSLTNNDSWVDFLSQLWFTFFAGSHDKITNSGSWETILATMNTNHRDNHE
jgi:hypothetical protein